MSGSYGQPGMAIAASSSPQPAAIAAPPPLPAPVQFYAAINGPPAGPLELNASQQTGGSGEIEEDPLVRNSGLPAWPSAGQHPPPPPPANAVSPAIASSISTMQP